MVGATLALRWDAMLSPAIDIPRVVREPVRRYVDRHGRAYRSVTNVLDVSGIVAFDMVPPDVLARAAAWGETIHAITAYHDDPARVDAMTESERTELSLMMFDAPHDNELGAASLGWSEFVWDLRLTPVLVEATVVSALHGFAGTLDRVFRRANGGYLLIDLKATSVLPKSAALQTAAYTVALSETYPGIGIARRAAAWWDGDRWRLCEYEARHLQRDFGFFLSALNVARYRQEMV